MRAADPDDVASVVRAAGQRNLDGDPVVEVDARACCPWLDGEHPNGPT
jgi:hypothetical protein